MAATPNVVNEELRGEGKINLLFNAKLWSAFKKYEYYTLNTLFTHLSSVVLYINNDSFNSVAIIVTLCLNSCSLHLNLLSRLLLCIPLLVRVTYYLCLST